MGWENPWDPQEASARRQGTYRAEAWVTSDMAILQTLALGDIIAGKACFPHLWKVLCDLQKPPVVYNLETSRILY